jgi:hypothetical protein
MSEFHTLAFADPDTASWGVTWLPGPEGRAQLALGHAGEVEIVPGSLRTGGPDDAWRLEGEGISLAFRAELGATSANGELSTADELCAVTGNLRVRGVDAEVDCLGWRSSARAESDLGGMDSLRFLAGWFDNADGFSLTSLRPRKARGQEADAAAAVVIEQPAPPPVEDPRLSTTYTAAGIPLRAGLELWFAEPPESESESEGEAGGSHRYPRRAAAEPAGPSAGWEVEGLDLHAALVRWRSHGREGPGVYVLGRRR